MEEYHKDAAQKDYFCRKEREKHRRHENKVRKKQLKEALERRRKGRGDTKASLKRRRREIAKNMKNAVEKRRRNNNRPGEKPSKRKILDDTVINKRKRIKTRTILEQTQIRKGNKRKEM